MRSTSMRTVLLGHRQVAAAEAGLHVRERDRRVRRGAGACEGRVRVPVDEDQVRRLLLDHARDLRLHDVGVGRVQVEPVARLGEPELLDEDLRERVVVVLARVDDDLVDPQHEERDGERRGLHELRTVPDDGEDFHGPAA